MRTHFLDSPLPIVVAGLEALLTVEKAGVTKLFVRRAEKLSDEIGVALSGEELRQAYKLRSEVAHGRSFLYDLTWVLPEAEHRPLYVRLESLLRGALKKCLLEPAF